MPTIFVMFSIVSYFVQPSDGTCVGKEKPPGLTPGVLADKANSIEHLSMYDLNFL